MYLLFLPGFILKTLWRQVHQELGDRNTAGGGDDEGADVKEDAEWGAVRTNEANLGDHLSRRV